MSGLPNGWSRATVGEVADTALGKMLDRGRPRGHQLVPYLRNVNVQWGRVDTDDVLTMELPADELERFQVLPGDLLVCEGGEIGRAAIWHGTSGYLAYQKALHRVRSRGDLNLVFLRYLLEHYRNNGTLAAHATGSTIAHLPQQQFRRLPVPLPPLDEQRRIVDSLDDHLSRLNQAELNLASTRLRRRALVRAALDVTTRAYADGTTTLGALVDRVEAGRSFAAEHRSARGDEWGVIKVSAMTWGTFRPEENKAVLDPARVDPRYEIKVGDVLVSRANTTDYVGAPVLVRETPPRRLLSDKSLRLIPRPGVDPAWLHRVLSAPAARRQMSERATGTKDSMRNISQASLLSIEVPLAGDKGQRAVIEETDQLDLGVARLDKALGEARNQAQMLRRALLEAAFSGRLTSPSYAQEIEELAGV